MLVFGQRYGFCVLPEMCQTVGYWKFRWAYYVQGMHVWKKKKKSGYLAICSAFSVLIQCWCIFVWLLRVAWQFVKVTFMPTFLAHTLWNFGTSGIFRIYKVCYCASQNNELWSGWHQSCDENDPGISWLVLNGIRTLHHWVCWKPELLHLKILLQAGNKKWKILQCFHCRDSFFIVHCVFAEQQDLGFATVRIFLF